MPVILREDRKLWCDREGMPLLEGYLREISNIFRPGSFFVMTNERTVLEFCKANGILAELVAPPTAEQTGILPYGSLEALSRLPRDIKVEGNDFLILDYHSPLVTPDILCRAAKEFQEGAMRILVSMKPAIDHPCQLNSYYRIRALGIIHLFDRNPPRHISDYFALPSLLNAPVTKPFYFDWQGRGIIGNAQRFYIRTYHDGKSEFSPLPSADQITEQSSPIWIRENTEQARLFFPLSNSTDQHEKRTLPAPHSIIGRTYPDGNGAGFLLQDGENQRFLLQLPPVLIPQRNFLLRIATISTTQNSKIPLEADLEFSETTDPVLPLPDGFLPEDSLFWSILEHAENGCYDIAEPFPDSVELWKSDPQQGTKVNIRTKEIISGRQNFPQVFERDGAFVFFRGEEETRIDDALLKGEAQGFVIKTTDSFRIHDPFDLLCWKIFQQARELNAGTH